MLNSFSCQIWFSFFLSTESFSHFCWLDLYECTNNRTLTWNVLNFDSIFFYFNPVSQCQCPSSSVILIILFHGKREIEEGKKRIQLYITHHSSLDHALQTVYCVRITYKTVLWTYIEFLIRFSIEWHFINLFYLSSLSSYPQSIFLFTSLSMALWLLLLSFWHQILFFFFIFPFISDFLVLRYVHCFI